MVRKGLAAGAAALAIVAVGWTALSQQAAPARPPGYLAEALNGAALVGAPPAEGSPRAVAERNHYEATRALQGSPRWAQATFDNELTPAALSQGFGCAAGVALSAGGTPATTRLLSRVGTDVGRASAASKGVHQRARPAVGNDRPICIPRDPALMENSSWPSGHAMLGWTYALLLAELVPTNADAVLLRGREFGDSRVVCGVHFQSDVEAGRTVAAALVARLHAEPQFVADMAAARAELAKAEAPENCPVSPAG
jgi:acid phosphatase (class A)